MTKQIISLLLLISLFLTNGFAQNNELSTVWQKSKTSPVAGASEGWGVSVDQFGEVYWPVGLDSLGQGLDIVCYKYDSQGNELWDTPLFYGGIGTQHAFVCNAKSDELYIGGRYCPLTGFSCDMLLVKADKATGNILWDRELDFGNTGYDEVDGLEIREDGIFCGGWGQSIQTGPYQIDMGLWKLDSDGNTEWTNSIGEPNSAEHLDGHFVVEDDYIYSCGLWGGTSLLNLYNGHSFLGKFSKEDGSLVDSVLFGNQSTALIDIDNALGMTSDGEFLYITGYTILPGSTDWQLFVTKFDYDLNQIWHTDWGGTGTETARGILVSEDNIYVAGVTESLEIMTGGGADALLLQLDTDGNYLSHHTWGETLKDSFRDIAIHEEQIYLAGSSAGQAGDSIAFLVKVDSSEFPSSIGSNEKQLVDIKLFPNPSSENLTIQLNSELMYKGEVDISIIDLSGKVLMQESVVSSEPRNYLLSISGLSSGKYYIRVKSGLQTHLKPFVVSQ